MFDKWQAEKDVKREFSMIFCSNGSSQFESQFEANFGNLFLSEVELGKKKSLPKLQPLTRREGAEHQSKFGSRRVCGSYFTSLTSESCNVIYMHELLATGGWTGGYKNGAKLPFHFGGRFLTSTSYHR